MFLGLDLRGGIHVLIDVDMDAAVDQARERYANDIRTQLRKEKVRYLTVAGSGTASRSSLRTPPARDAGEKVDRARSCASSTWRRRDRGGVCW